MDKYLFNEDGEVKALQPNPGPREGLQMVHKTKLRKPDYQRTTPKKWQSIADNWEDGLLQTLSISYRDGKLWIVDGCNRWQAAMSLEDVGLLPCNVEFLTYGEELDRYTKLNRPGARLNMSAFDLHRAEVLKKDDIALAMDRDAFASGLSLGRREDCGMPFIGWISTLRKIYETNQSCGRWIMEFLGVAAKADHRQPKEIKMYLADPLAALYAASSVRNNQLNLARYFGHAIGFEEAQRRLKTVGKRERPLLLAKEILEFNRPRANKVIDLERVAAGLVRRKS